MIKGQIYIYRNNGNEILFIFYRKVWEGCSKVTILASKDRNIRAIGNPCNLEHTLYTPKSLAIIPATKALIIDIFGQSVFDNLDKTVQARIQAQ